MPLIVNSYISALNAQRQLLQSGKDLDQASERLASGKRVNSAADDAAGLAIANRQTAQIRGLNQAVRNANDGISLIQTAEGALDETTNILQRIRELAIQSANGIYSDADRSTLNAEVQQLKDEIDRIAQSTSFNGQNILDGSLGDVELQVGAKSNQTIDFSIDGFSTSSLGGVGGDLIGSAVTGLSSITALDGDDISVNGVTLTSLTSATTVNEAIDSINADLEGVSIVATAVVTHEADGVGSGTLGAGNDSMTITLVDGDANTQTYVLSGTSSMDELIDKINSETSVSAALNDENKLVLTAENALSITVADTTTGDGASGFSNTDAGYFSLVFNDTSLSGNTIQLQQLTSSTQSEIDLLGLNFMDDDENLLGAALTANATNNINAGDLIINGVEIGAIDVGTSTAATIDNVILEINKLSAESGVVAFEHPDGGGEQIALRGISGDIISVEYGSGADTDDVLDITGLREQNAVAGAGSVAGIDVSTVDGSQRAISVVDEALEQINDTRSQLGAVNNRLDFSIANLSNISEKSAQARSRIIDADFAAESAGLSRAQVLQQASQAMLAQANARPQQVLQLLQ